MLGCANQTSSLNYSSVREHFFPNILISTGVLSDLSFSKACTRVNSIAPKNIKVITCALCNIKCKGNIVLGHLYGTDNQENQSIKDQASSYSTDIEQNAVMYKSSKTFQTKKKLEKYCGIL